MSLCGFANPCFLASLTMAAVKDIRNKAFLWANRCFFIGECLINTAPLKYHLPTRMITLIVFFFPKKVFFLLSLVHLLGGSSACVGESCNLCFVLVGLQRSSSPEFFTPSQTQSNSKLISQSVSSLLNYKNIHYLSN